METIIKNIRNRIIKISYENDLFHIGSCLSCVEIIATLYFKSMKTDDNFLLSKGHAGLAWYATLVEKKILDKIDFQKLDTHPNKDLTIGSLYTSGSLGQGLSLGCGLALADSTKNTFVVLSDGECDEGSIWEAAKFAQDNKLKNLIAIVDCNKWKAYDKATSREDFKRIWEAFKWEVNFLSQDKEMDFKSGKEGPVVYLVDTIKGKGLDFMEGKLESHWLKLTKKQYEENICKRT